MDDRDARNKLWRQATPDERTRLIKWASRVREENRYAGKPVPTLISVILSLRNHPAFPQDLQPWVKEILPLAVKNKLEN